MGGNQDGAIHNVEAPRCVARRQRGVPRDHHQLVAAILQRPQRRFALCPPARPVTAPSPPRHCLITAAGGQAACDQSQPTGTAERLVQQGELPGSIAALPTVLVRRCRHSRCRSGTWRSSTEAEMAVSDGAGASEARRQADKNSSKRPDRAQEPARSLPARPITAPSPQLELRQHATSHSRLARVVTSLAGCTAWKHCGAINCAHPAPQAQQMSLRYMAVARRSWNGGG